MIVEPNYFRRVLTTTLLTLLLWTAGWSSLQAGSEIEPIPPTVRAEMEKYSWRTGCPTNIEDLSLVNFSYWGYDGQTHQGRVIVHRPLAVEVREIFGELYDQRFPLAQVRLIDDYQGSDDASMADNNTSAFNCRVVAGTTRWSRHALGRAIDLNPLINPYVKGDQVSPPAGARYVDRNQTAPGLIKAGDACHQAFVKRGWQWGGDWSNRKDYQHFEK